MRSLLSTLRPAAALRRLGVRLAFVAALALALMPTVSRLMQPVGLADWATICQATPSPAGSGSQHDTAHGDACAFCSLAHSTPVLASGAPAAVGLLAYAPPAPRAPSPVRASVTQARAPSARGPPSLA